MFRLMTTSAPGAMIGRPAYFALLFTTILLVIQSTAFAQASDDAESPKPITTADEQIPVEELQILLKPLTKAELVVEVEGWRDLVKGILTEIGDTQIKILREKNGAAAEEAEDEAASDEVPADEAPAGEATPATEDVEQADEEETAIEQLPQLQARQAAAILRLEAAIESLEKKGGDVEAYRQYVSAVTGLSLDVTDAATTWTIMKAWLTSEQGGQRWMWNVIKFLVVLAAFYFGASIIARLARHAVSRVKGVSQLLTNFVGSFVKQLLMVIGFIVALAALEVNIAPLLAAIGATGFVIGLALQGTLSNFASGLLILFYRPFDVGDVIEAGGVSGIVNSVTLVSTHVRTFDNKLMIVPNNDIWGGTITNATASDTRRVDMIFGIGYDDNVEQARGILERLVADHPLVHKDPAPVVQLNELADSSVNFICRPWSSTADYWTVYWDITKSVKNEFDKSGISIPYPQRDVHVYREAGSE